MNREIVQPGGAGVYPLNGDVLSTAGNALVAVVGIQQIPISATPPSDNDVLTYVGLDHAWEAKPVPSIELQTNGTDNGSQTKLNLAAGANVTLVDSGSGTVTISASSAGGTVTSNANGVSVDYGNGYIHQFGKAGPSSTGTARTSFAVVFPVAFSAPPQSITCTPQNDPDSYGTAVYSAYASNITNTGFLMNLTCGVTIGGGGPSNIVNPTYVSWMADKY